MLIPTLKAHLPKCSNLTGILLLSISILLAWQATLYSMRDSTGNLQNPCEFDSTLASELQLILNTEIERLDVPGVSVAIHMADQGIWLGTSGVSEPFTPDSIRPDMLFSIASITKTFMAALILQLNEEGALSIDDSLYRWLPAYPHIDSTISIRQLLNHTSGIFSFHENPAFWDTIFAAPDHFWTAEDMILTFVERPYFQPGEAWHYSNTNYLLLGIIIREATDSEVSHELRTRFLEPLNLTNTYLDIEEEIQGDIAHDWYDIDRDGEPEDISGIPRTSRYSAIWTGGAMVSTAEDVSNWIRVLYGGDVLSGESREEMLDFMNIPYGWYPITGYGLGTERFELFERELWGHAGDIPGFNSVAVHSPELDVTITVLVNCSVDNSANEIACELLEFILDYLDVESPHSESETSPNHFDLLPNFPNPFNSSTSLQFLLPQPSEVSLTIHDVSGREIATLVNDQLVAGYYRINWYSGSNPSGVYFCRLDTADFNKLIKLVLLE